MTESEREREEMEAEGEEKARSAAHVLLLPYPTQGHINPMLELGKRLVARGLVATIAITRFVARSSGQQPQNTAPVRVEQISDGYDEGGFAVAESIQAYLDGFKAAGSRTLAEVILEEELRGRPVGCVVYDAFLPWALDVAKGTGLLAAAFFTQSCAVEAVYYHVYHGRLAGPSPGPTESVVLEGLPELTLEDLPSFIAGPGTYPAFLAMVVNQFSNLEKADAVLVNTFHRLESQVVRLRPHTFLPFFSRKLMI